MSTRRCYARSVNRSYGDQCGVARSLDVIGERWALLIVRELLLGPKRFNDLLAGLPGASPNVISQRLRELTDWGYELEPVIVHLGQWGTQAPLPEDAGWSLDSLLIALQAAADPTACSGRYELRVGADVFTVDGTSGFVRVRRGTAEQPDAMLSTDADTFHAVTLGIRSILSATESGDLRFGGDPKAIGGLTSLLQSLTRSPQPPNGQVGAATGGR
jgi:DNA-binding HxlR family transcriptional regulator